MRDRPRLKLKNRLQHVHELNTGRKRTSARKPSTTTVPVPPLVQWLRVTETLPLLPLQMTSQRIAPAERLPTPSDHQHSVELEYLRLPHGRSWHAQLDRVRHGHPATHPVRNFRAARMSLDVSLEIG